MNRNIFIASNSVLQSKFLAQVIEQGIGRRCLHIQIADVEKHVPRDVKPKDLLLHDMANQELDTAPCLRKFFAKPMNHDVHIALINVAESGHMEEIAIEGGCRGVFVSTDSIEHICKGISSILQGELWFSRKALSRYVLKTSMLDKIVVTGARVKLTQREIQILSIIASGGTNNEISRSLNISMNTVKCHVYNIFSKIDAGNRTQAAIWAANNSHIFFARGA